MGTRVLIFVWKHRKDCDLQLKSYQKSAKEITDTPFPKKLFLQVS